MVLVRAGSCRAAAAKQDVPTQKKRKEKKKEETAVTQFTLNVNAGILSSLRRFYLAMKNADSKAENLWPFSTPSIANSGR